MVTSTELADWLRQCGNQSAATLISECELEAIYVDTAFELSGDREIEIIDFQIKAPAAIYSKIGSNLRSESSAIEQALHEIGPSSNCYIRSCSWVPLLRPSATPIAEDLGGRLQGLNLNYVESLWKKALARMGPDPDGAMTAARTLVESVCKQILDELKIPIASDAPLPVLFGKTMEHLKIAPAQVNDARFKKVLGQCQSIIQELGQLRNTLSDAHGKRSKDELPNHLQAELVVNLAGSLAHFLLGVFEHSRTEICPEVDSSGEPECQ